MASIRFQELKAAASAWNKAGNKEKAREYLRQAKEVQSGATLLPPSPTMPDSVPVSSASSSCSSKAAAAPPAAAVVAESKELRELKGALDRLRTSRALRRATDSQKWNAFLTELREEARRCNGLALELKETDKKLAVECFRRQKECLRMLEQALELKNSGAECPSSWKASLVFPIRRVISNPSVAEDAMAVSVLRGGDVASADGKPISSFVKLVYSYHPTEGFVFFFFFLFISHVF